METNLDSVLDRIRILEEKMERGIPVVSGANRNSGNMPGGAYPNTEDHFEIAEAPKPEKAAPEDLQRVKNNWRSIVGQTEGMFKSFLSTAVPKYNGSTGENKLYVEFSNDLAQTCVNDPGKKELLEAIIAQQIGKSVEVELVLKKGETHKNLAEISVDDILKQSIHMDVIVEDESEDEL